MKLKRGQKLCGNCNQINGARAYVCKHCNTAFEIRNKKTGVVKKRIKRFENVDWATLEVGDKIRIFGRSGNYFVNSAGEKTYLSDPGIYTIFNKDDNGLIVNDKGGAFGYIYMGEEKPHHDIPNMYRSPHKIVKVNTPVRM